MALFHDFSGDRTDHRIPDLENGMYDKTVLRRFSQLTGRITDQHVCLVCGHVLELSTNPISAGYIDYGRRVSLTVAISGFSRIAG